MYKQSQFQEQDISKESFDKKGVVFYLKNNTVVGILTWNTGNKVEIGRKVDYLNIFCILMYSLYVYFISLLIDI